MDKIEFLTIFCSFENFKSVKITLPSVISETKRTNSRLIVHDSSLNNRDEKWNYLNELNSNNDFFLILSSNMSLAHARNMCLSLGQELYAPEYICIMEDDHGFNEGFISEIVSAMKKYYGKVSPNNLRYGLFTGCSEHIHCKEILLDDNNSYPDVNSLIGSMGGVNNCIRCAPTNHWNNVLKKYDTDEYLISYFQTANMNYRNYNKGFTHLLLKQGQYVFSINNENSRGSSDNSRTKLWDKKYTASDIRANFKVR